MTSDSAIRTAVPLAACTIAPSRGLDCYMTPAWVIHALLEAHRLPDGPVVEPAAGDGALVAALASQGRRVIAVDVRPEAVEASLAAGAERGLCGDWLTLGEDAIQHYEPAAIVANPPYSRAQEFAEVCLAPLTAPGSLKCVALLLRLGFMAGQKRAAFWRRHPLTALYPLGKRPSFTADGRTDATDYGWFVWERGAKALRMAVLLPGGAR
jgi:hypothetical protein